MILRRTLVGAACAALVLVGSAPSSAGPLAPTKPSQIVTLDNLAGAACPVIGKALDQQILPDGTRKPFVIPPKTVLVVTEVGWGATGAGATKATGVVLTTQAVGDSTASAIFLDTAITDSVGFATKNNLVASAIVSADRTLCAHSTGAAGNTLTVIVRGFLTKAK